jgi:putative methyltransferase
LDFFAVGGVAGGGVQVKGVILDPSCSGSGTTVSRMDHLLPGSSNSNSGAAAAGDGSTELDEQEQQRVEQLAKFQVGLVCKTTAWSEF